MEACSHTKVWKCDCGESALEFCSECLLLHLQEPASHRVAALGEVKPYLCGACKEHCSEAVRYRYPVVVCRKCAGERSEVRTDAGLGEMKGSFGENIQKAMKALEGLDEVCRRAEETELKVRETEEKLRECREELLRGYQ